MPNRFSHSHCAVEGLFRVSNGLTAITIGSSGSIFLSRKLPITLKLGWSFLMMCIISIPSKAPSGWLATITKFPSLEFFRIFFVQFIFDVEIVEQIFKKFGSFFSITARIEPVDLGILLIILKARQSDNRKDPVFSNRSLVNIFVLISRITFWLSVKYFNYLPQKLFPIPALFLSCFQNFWQCIKIHLFTFNLKTWRYFINKFIELKNLSSTQSDSVIAEFCIRFTLSFSWWSRLKIRLILYFCDKWKIKRGQCQQILIFLQNITGHIGFEF